MTFGNYVLLFSKDLQVNSISNHVSQNLGPIKKKEKNINTFKTRYQR